MRLSLIQDQIIDSSSCVRVSLIGVCRRVPCGREEKSSLSV